MTSIRTFIDHEQFRKLFPFYFVIDQSMHIVETGSVLARLCPEMTIGIPLKDSFKLSRYGQVDLDEAFILRQTASLIVFEAINSTLFLRMQVLFLENPRRFLFVGSPWLRDAEEVKVHGIVLTDFAIHDPTVDQLQLNKSTRISLRDAKELNTKLEQRNIELQGAYTETLEAYTETLEGWARTLDAKDSETEIHSKKVTRLTMDIAKRFGIADQDLEDIRRGALLHDIGKMKVPDVILLKSGPLTEDEWGIMRTHPQIAYDILKPIKYLAKSLDIPYCHHEKWDGTGYPRKLKGDEIPFAARIFAVVDVWDALTSDRPYRKAWTRERVTDHMKANSGTHFEPEVLNTFLQMMSENQY